MEVAEHRSIETALRLRRELGLAYAWPERWPKEAHLQRLGASGRFVYVREVQLHGTEVGDAERCVRQAINGMVEDLDEFSARGVTDEQLGLAAFRAVAARVIGAGSRWFNGWRVRLAVKA